jgi:ferredoxin
MESQIQEKIRQEARRLLEEQEVDLIIGYEEGSLPLQTTPCFISEPGEVDRLVWNACCKQNLAGYAHQAIVQHRRSQARVKPEERTEKRVGIVARGCTSRSLVIHLQERQYDRDNLYIIGVPCTGYLDKNKLAAAVTGEEITAGRLEGDKVIIETASGERQLERQQVLADNCLTCRFNNPVISDFMAGDPAPENSGDEFALVAEFAAKPEAERWEYFAAEMNKCMRCYACRNVCPSCYCPSCFVEQSQPEWVGAGINPSDNQVFQVMRMFHMAGRCVDCGSCVEVCAEGVDLRTFLKKLDLDDWQLYQHRAGADLDQPSPLASFRENDPEEFILEPEQN